MRKRISRRRWKARALQGQTIPWSAIVDHRLEKWGEWERRFDYMDAYLMNVLSETSLEGMMHKIRNSLAEGQIISVHPATMMVTVIPPEDFYL